jgi:hypothetical protein
VASENRQLRLREQGVKDDALYERFAKHLEGDHRGKFVAINKDGKIIVSRDDIEVVQRAIQDVGKGQFAFRRIGYEALGKWRLCA